jgi:DNA processing protein
MNREAFLTAWLTLAFTNKVGSKTFEKLLKQFKTPSAVLENIAEVKRRFKLELEPPSKAEIEDLIAKCYNFQGEIILPIDDIYPDLLREIEGYPQVLFAKGKIELLNSQKIAIVGTRNSSANGERITRKIAYELGKNGIVVVSGLARGIDAAAHEASLEGGTIAVVAGGIDVIYPRENDKLQKMLYEKGLVISENVMGTVATSSNFPRRNRIISGMSKGVLIVEAMEKSGTMITANYALEQGRDVFAVPGSPLDQRAFGTNLLIKNGAILTRDASDILGELGYETAAREEESKRFEEPSSINEKILIKLSNVPTDIDDLFNIVNISTSEFNRALTELEILGKITRQGNKISLI